ncbi:hypothetical protein [Clavibacter michiganensis]|uniref:Uncharacterized protein n=1 Tax=Clavibacter michiganensis subsp. insidiosus TaxID=33014 RepID=A0A0D5CHW5_9MICO|nr:hypothetical protein [Clavibacter michiganensis]AJW78857.1 hypothetical protein VO01_06665 [Clavibacter michiganensis subsp. insidiosus]AWF98478.1 hypothetical protein BEH61_08165 [Clavibacter michiganensis subsp. insidiosus]AWG01322.1 hypothetical protein BEH62_06910 [Clavibacter michiganensis subsp. insidiosus]OQJ60133.1 hypothetical protein B5P21_09580 [Clavibacter michiganensis subsp. insidiosus]RII86977.1 hypothetical protein DZF92_08610 [Clavibacter michiganensis subsp. insidiosus]
MPSLPLDPRPDRAPHDPSPTPPTAGQPTTVDADTASVGARAPESVPVDPEAERARWRDRRTGVIALVVVTIALWAVIAAAVGFATTM